jgi:NADH:ubiquinone oxidoreductase subunit E
MVIHFFMEIFSMSGKPSGKKKVVIKEITPEEWEKVDQIIAAYKDKPGSLIPVLQQVQEVCGFLPEEVQNRVAEGLNTHPSHVYGVVTFYSFFTTVPRGRNVVRLCMGTACYVQGTNKMLGKLKQNMGIDVDETTDDLRYTLETVRCLGACGLAPVMVINKDTHGLLETAKAIDIIKEYE